MDLPDLNAVDWPTVIAKWRENFDGRKPCYGLNTNTCVAEGCYNEACLKEKN